MRLQSDRHFLVAVPPAALWAELEQVDRYRRWWPWLREFDGQRLADGEEWHCLVQPPLPYRVRFTVRLDAVELPHRVRATVTGDVAGIAAVEVTPHGDGSRARFASQLEPSNGLLKVMARWAGPMARRGHDWVIDTAARQFLERIV